MSDTAIRWLLGSRDPSVRYLTLRQICGEPENAESVRSAQEEIPSGHRVRALLRGQRRDGGFGVHPYKKWTGSFWRLVSLVDLEIPAGHLRAMAALDEVLRWIGGEGRAAPAREVRGLVRAHAVQEGMVLVAACRLGLAGDERVRRIAHPLVEWQWPDGGWNCDPRPQAKHSSFHETWGTLYGLAEFHRATGDRDALAAAERAAEFLLAHRLYGSCRKSSVVYPELLKLHYPPYWHYDVLAGLRMMAVVDKLDDPRAKAALDGLERLRRPDGSWRAGGYYWRPVGVSGVDVVDWGRGGPNEMITLHALRVLGAAGRL